MAVLLATATGQVNAVLDGNTSSPRVYGTVNDPLITPTEITNAILGADLYVRSLISETPNHPLLSALIGSTTVAHAALLPSRIGQIHGIKVDGKVPTPYPVNEIENERTNARGLTLIEKHYNISVTPIGEILAHNGSADATVYFIAPLTITSACQSPDQMLPAVVAFALAEITQKQGAKTEAAGYWQRRSEFFAAQIRSGAMQLPEAA